MMAMMNNLTTPLSYSGGDNDDRPPGDESSSVSHDITTTTYRRRQQESNVLVGVGTEDADCCSSTHSLLVGGASGGDNSNNDHCCSICFECPLSASDDDDAGTGEPISVREGPRTVTTYNPRDGYAQLPCCCGGDGGGDVMEDDSVFGGCGRWCSWRRQVDGREQGLRDSMTPTTKFCTECVLSMYRRSQLEEKISSYGTVSYGNHTPTVACPICRASLEVRILPRGTGVSLTHTRAITGASEEEEQRLRQRYGGRASLAVIAAWQIFRVAASTVVAGASSGEDDDEEEDFGVRRSKKETEMIDTFLLATATSLAFLGLAQVIGN